MNKSGSSQTPILQQSISVRIVGTKYKIKQLHSQIRDTQATLDKLSINPLSFITPKFNTWVTGLEYNISNWTNNLAKVHKELMELHVKQQLTNDHCTPSTFVPAITATPAIPATPATPATQQPAI